MSKKMNQSTKPDLTEVEKQEPYAMVYERAPAEIPPTIINEIESGPKSSDGALPFERINDLLNPGYLAIENGYCTMPDGAIFVAVHTEMPRISREMLDWWFWWHVMSSLRYKIWYPEKHYSITLDGDLAHYENQKGPYRQRYWNTTNFPIEDVGLGVETLSINFISPSDFGFDVSRFEEARVETVICANVGSVSKKLKQHTVMCHFVRKIETGVEMRSRFWLGQRIILKDGTTEKSLINRLLNRKTVRQLAVPREAGFELAMHCAQEYNNLAAMLPELFDKYAERGNHV